MNELIARVPDPDERVAYYKYCMEGRPVFGPKKEAAQLGDQRDAVLRQLRTMLPGREFETVGQSVRFKRRAKENP